MFSAQCSLLFRLVGRLVPCLLAVLISRKCCCAAFLDHMASTSCNVTRTNTKMHFPWRDLRICWHAMVNASPTYLLEWILDRRNKERQDVCGRSDRLLCPIRDPVSLTFCEVYKRLCSLAPIGLCRGSLCTQVILDYCLAILNRPDPVVLHKENVWIHAPCSNQWYVLHSTTLEACCFGVSVH